MNINQVYDVRARNQEVSPEIHETRDAQRLKEACQQFESILWAQIWKDSKNGARKLGGGETRAWKQMEDLSVEMASEEIAKSGGSGLWKVLYDQMIVNVAAAAKTASEEQS